MRSIHSFNRAAAIVFAALFAGDVGAAPVTLLHSFSGGSADGRLPRAGLILDGGVLYGTTSAGGGGTIFTGSDAGTVFRLNADGSDYQVLHSFGRPTGAQPSAELTLDGSILYGTTRYGGDRQGGTIFRINTDGSDVRVVYSFRDRSLETGYQPQAQLVLSGSALFGTTGGTGTGYHYGTVFRVNTDGQGFQQLHLFNEDDGEAPFDGVKISGSTLYGVTTLGGADIGTVFRMNMDGTGFQTLHSFDNAPGNLGHYPHGLIVSGETLYGVTAHGGPELGGVVYRMNIDGSGYEVLHAFGRNGFLSAEPNPDLLKSGNWLFGTTSAGGASGFGSVFALRTDGSEFRLLHEFSGGPLDGRLPNGSLVRHGDALFGTTQSGGINDMGTVFSIPVPEPSSVVLALLAIAMLARHPHCRSTQGA